MGSGTLTELALLLIDETKKELDMLKQDLLDFIESQDSIYEQISEIIGYGNLGNDDPICVDYINKEWFTQGDDLFIMIYEDEDEYYSFIISSYSAQGEKLYIGESDGLTYVMAYQDDAGWDQTSIYVLSNEMKRKEED